MRTEDGRGSGWVGRNLQHANQFDAGDDIEIAKQKALDSAEAKALEPRSTLAFTDDDCCLSDLLCHANRPRAGLYCRLWAA